MDPLISFNQVTKSFGEIQALGLTDLQLVPGEFVCLIGPSGCGKSTVLRLAAGLAEPTYGAIDVHSKDIGYVFQDATLMPWRTVRENVEFLGQLDGMDRDERTKRTNEVLELVGLEHFDNHYPLALSGGMKMRTSIARSLLLDPDVFLLDEPFGALDQISRSKMNEELSSLFVQRKFAALLVTHSIEEAIFLGSRLLVMCRRPGRIVAEFDIPFSFPRTSEIRYEPAFTEIAGEVAKALEAAS